MTEISLNHDEAKQADFKFTHIVSTNPRLTCSYLKMKRTRLNNYGMTVNIITHINRSKT